MGGDGDRILAPLLRDGLIGVGDDVMGRVTRLLPKPVIEVLVIIAAIGRLLLKIHQEQMAVPPLDQLVADVKQEVGRFRRFYQRCVLLPVGHIIGEVLLQILEVYVGIPGRTGEEQVEVLTPHTQSGIGQTRVDLVGVPGDMAVAVERPKAPIGRIKESFHRQFGERTRPTG